MYTYIYIHTHTSRNPLNLRYQSFGNYVGFYLTGVGLGVGLWTRSSPPWSLVGHGAKGVRFRVFKRIAAQNNGESDGNWHYRVV